MRINLTLAAAALLAATAVTAALATPSRGITDVVNFVSATHDEPIRAKDDGIKLKAKDATTVFMQTATFQPGGSSGWHGHVGLVFLAVKSGTLTRYDHHCRAEQFPAGEYLLESGDHPILVRNEGTEPAQAYITYVMPADDPTRRIDLPNPGCPVD